MLKRSLIACGVAIVCGVLSTYAQQANRPARASAAGRRAAGSPSAGRSQALPVPARAAAVPAVATVSDADQKAFINQYCIACHSERAKAAGMDSARKLALDGLDPANVAHDAKTWELVVRKLRAGMMPPAGMKRPEPAAFDAMIALVRAASSTRRPCPSRRAPGPAPAEPHRIRQRGPRSAGPRRSTPRSICRRDDSTSGFDNIAGALGPVVHARRGVRVGGAEDQPPGARLSGAADAGGLPHA